MTFTAALRYQPGEREKGEAAPQNKREEKKKRKRTQVICKMRQ